MMSEDKGGKRGEGSRYVQHLLYPDATRVQLYLETRVGMSDGRRMRVLAYISMV